MGFVALTCTISYSKDRLQNTDWTQILTWLGISGVPGASREKLWLLDHRNILQDGSPQAPYPLGTGTNPWYPSTWISRSLFLWVYLSLSLSLSFWSVLSTHPGALTILILLHKHDQPLSISRIFCLANCNSVLIEQGLLVFPHLQLTANTISTFCLKRIWQLWGYNGSWIVHCLSNCPLFVLLYLLLSFHMMFSRLICYK